jgi:hypothetical protein
MSAIKPTTIWVEAGSPDHARRKVQLATLGVTAAYVPGQELPVSPWINAALVTCVEDTSRQVPSDFVVTESGEQIPCPKLC